MIELNEKTQQDFLNRKWVQKLLDAGVDMSDAKYYISNLGYIVSKDYKTNTEQRIADYFKKHPDEENKSEVSFIPTYTVSELLYKLHEWIWPTIDGEKYSGGLNFCKDAPFYIWYYALKTHDYDPQLQQGKYNENYIQAVFEYPIEGLASLLIQCHKKDIGIKTKDTGDISDK